MENPAPRVLVIAAREYSDPIAHYLANAQLAVFTVERADQLVEALRRARPTVITVDCVSPQMNGHAVLHWLRADGGAREIPAILITVGRGQHKIADEDRTAAVDFVDVPLHEADFVARVKALHSIGRSPAAAAPAPRPATKTVAPNKTVMIVEDDTDHSNLMRNLLEAEGYKVVESSNLDAFKNCILMKPDLLLLDLMMPVVDGFVLAEVFKACRLTRQIPIVFLTALHDAQYVDAARDLQAAAFLTKPVTIANFLTTLEGVLKA